ncbi:hypothetical protein BS50DRAFT_576937 [Corynespora cassiicola Philippines]|uniref:Uncharacterized protein n=1 Tax=Corynespora cassiicola Philippines TaxID=1448308 RepID=A0A2T2NCI8_CORCC|nr:hypothetical protein BS50DRAFT_576937 [Corynespora cassiicola Philippines]
MNSKQRPSYTEQFGYSEEARLEAFKAAWQEYLDQTLIPPNGLSSHDPEIPQLATIRNDTMEWIPSDVVEHTPEVLIHQSISIPLGLYSPFASGQLPAASELNVSTNLWGLDQGFSGDYVQHSADTGVERGTQDLMEIGDNDVAFGYTGGLYEHVEAGGFSSWELQWFSLSD